MRSNEEPGTREKSPSMTRGQKFGVDKTRDGKGNYILCQVMLDVIQVAVAYAGATRP